MPDLARVLREKLQAAFDTIVPGADPTLRPSDRADFQANGALALAKQVGRPPRDIAEDVAAAVSVGGVCAVVEVSGPGFINLTLSDGFVASQLRNLSADPRLGVDLAEHPQTVVIDYSAPNVAKEMHIGHLRSTLIGDSLARVLGFLGHTVLRENHIGDWGTPFGMLIEYLIEVDGAERAESFSVRDLNEFYAAARSKFDAEPDFAERCRSRVVLLQGGDEETLRLWRVFVAESMRHAGEVYALLGVLLTPEDIVGESYYNPFLPVVVDELTEKGLLVENDGALCVFPAGFENRQGEPLPLIVRKSDGGYGYPATDLAATRDRTGRLDATKLVYVVGAEQALHLRLVFAVATMAGYLRDVGEAEHVGFGMVLGTDGKKLASRSGDSERLIDLLTEGVERAGAAMKDRDSELTPEEQAVVAHALGVGAVKYADLSTERMRDYVFDWDRMLAFEGNTGPYLQYAHARIRSIFRRAGVAPPKAGTPMLLDEPQERALALQLLRFSEAVETTADTSSPSKLCAYLFDLASSFTTFYEACRVLVDDESIRTSRLALCDVTARVLECGLSLLGMEAPAQM
jgi:arginyl-tRNA synthetase